MTSRGAVSSRFGDVTADEIAQWPQAAPGTLLKRTSRAAPAEPQRTASEGPPPWPPRQVRGPLLAIGVLALAGAGAFFYLAPKAAAGGWLLALVFCSGVSIGSLVAMMIHAVTGGLWGERFAAFFVPNATGIILTGALFAPVLARLSFFYPWVADGSSVPRDVSQLYLNVPFFIGRTVVALTFWSALALVLPRLSGAAAVLVAALGLAIHSLIIGLVGVDWILSLEPTFISTSFGATLAITQLASAFAVALVASPGRDEDTGLADLGGLLLAALLGLAYLNFITVLVIWYGDLPHKAEWFVRRLAFPWLTIGFLAFMLGSVVPIFSLFLKRIRESRLGLRVVGAITLVGVALYYAFLIAPAFGILSLGAALVVLAAFSALLSAFVCAPWARSGFYKWMSRHGR